MHYFTEEEAYKISHELQVCCGRNMLYDPNHPTGIVLSIHPQESGFEIADFGEIRKGYYVIVVFKERSGLDVKTFCELNNLSPVHATHSQLTDGLRNQLVTKKYLHGTWSHISGGNNLTVKIDNRNVTIKGRMNGTEEIAEFSDNGHWNSDYCFFFTGNPNYIINHADDKSLGISKLKTPGNIDGNFLWKILLPRIN